MLHIVKKGGLFTLLSTSTSKIAKDLRISQQTISRKLREMETLGLLTRNVSPKGLSIILTQKARDFLKQHFNELNIIFSKKTGLVGIIETGVGEGKYYVALPAYQRQFKNKLNFKAFPGTLNLKTKKEDTLLFLNSSEPIKINGFTTKSRTYGSLTCYKVKIDNIEAAIVIPERARHGEDIIEVLAPVNLRKKLNLKDGTKIKLSVENVL